MNNPFTAFHTEIQTRKIPLINCCIKSKSPLQFAFAFMESFVKFQNSINCQHVCELGANMHHVNSYFVSR